MVQQKYYKAALDRLKADRGPVDPDFLARNKHRSRMIRAVGKAIKDKELRTVPEIKAILYFESHEIVKAINHLMKYGGLKMINKRGEYPEYDYREDNK